VKLFRSLFKRSTDINRVNLDSDIFSLGNDLAKTDNILNQTSLILLGLAYYAYQKEKHLLGEMSFAEWIDSLVYKFESDNGKVFKD